MFGPVITRSSISCWCFPCLFLGLAACGSDPAPVDAGRDAATACEPLGAFAWVNQDGAPEPLSAPAGTARAGRLALADLPDDPGGLGDWRVDDFVLSNGRVAAIVSDRGPGQVYDPYGGRVVGLGRVQGERLVEMADYNLLMLALGRFSVATEGVSVIADGTDGGAATVRAVGTLTPILALADLLDALVPGDFEGVPAAIDYTLGPDSDLLEVTMHVRAPAEGIRATLGALQIFFQGFRMQPWRPGAGFAEATGELPFVAFDDPDATSFAWMGAEGEPLSPLFGTSGVDIFRSGRLLVPGCEEGTIVLGRMAIGGPGISGVQRAIADAVGTSTTPVEGSVSNADGSPASDVRVHVSTADGEHLTRFFPGPDGSFSVEVDARAAQLSLWRAGQPLVGPLPLVPGANDVSMPATGTVRLEAVSSVDGSALPARMEIFPATGSPPAPAPELGEWLPGSGRSRIAFPADGVETFTLLPGDYRVRVSRGPEYERVDTMVTVSEGVETPLVAALTRVVPTPGVLCADFHIHTTRSIDSEDPGERKIRALVADGLEIAIRSEHEWVSDFQPLIDELGLASFVRGLSGLELTTFTWGHFGVFPLTPDPALPSAGAFFWYERDAPAVFDEVRARAGSPTLIINHPRAGGIRQGYFTEAGFDPLTGSVARPELWDEDFSVVEVFNSSDFEGARDNVVQDWFSLLNSGRRVFAVGSSDSHQLAVDPAGWPRTCLAVGLDEPSMVTPEQVRDATQAGHSTINGGIYMQVRASGGEGPGDTASGVGAATSLEVELYAASHVDVDQLEIIVDGATTELIPIVPGDADPMNPVVRARATIDVDVASTGSWVVLHASGETAFDTNAHRPFVVSNPIFLTR